VLRRHINCGALPYWGDPNKRPWRVDYIGKGGKHLGTVEAPDEKSAIEQAAKQFNITPARRFKIAVTKVEKRNH
jgi:hypothetical protein